VGVYCLLTEKQETGRTRPVESFVSERRNMENYNCVLLTEEQR
jgi:hypothetical protein